MVWLRYPLTGAQAENQWELDANFSSDNSKKGNYGSYCRYRKRSSFSRASMRLSAGSSHHTRFQRLVNEEMNIVQAQLWLHMFIFNYLDD
jgi:hypothetical protein